MPRILKNIRIDEVSACTKGAGMGTKIVLMKRDTSADGDDVYNTVWYRQQAAASERMNDELLASDERVEKAISEELLCIIR